MVCAISASAQTAHSSTLNWTASQGATGYNVYRATCGTITSGLCTAGEGTYSNIGATVGNATTNYVDNAVTAGAQYVYYVTATATGFVESNPSNKVAVKIPLDQLPAPVLGPVTVALNTKGANQNILAQWSVSPAQSVRYTVRDGQNVQLTSGVTPNTSIAYTTKKRVLPIQVTVCAGDVCKSATS
jgi:fibronectin type 3 domain-containing protein